MTISPPFKGWVTWGIFQSPHPKDHGWSPEPPLRSQHNATVRASRRRLTLRLNAGPNRRAPSECKHASRPARLPLRQLNAAQRDPLKRHGKAFARLRRFPCGLKRRPHQLRASPADAQGERRQLTIETGLRPALRARFAQLSGLPPAPSVALGSTRLRPTRHGAAKLPRVMAKPRAATHALQRVHTFLHRLRRRFRPALNRALRSRCASQCSETA